MFGFRYPIRLWHPEFPVTRMGMKKRVKAYRAMISSDWNGCLAPCGPFDFLLFKRPEKGPELGEIFRQYTGNRITLGQAARRVKSLLPESVESGQMDAYLDANFCTYTGVPELIKWCRSQDILFMINTTGMIGYFQRVFAKGLLPRVEALSAHPMIRYPRKDTDPKDLLELFEIQDKGRNTAAIARAAGVPFHKVVVMGDSGGDGPHFEWGSRAGALIVGSMTKPSLEAWCQDKGIRVHHRFGRSCAAGERPLRKEEMKVDFMGLADFIAGHLL